MYPTSNAPSRPIGFAVEDPSLGPKNTQMQPGYYGQQQQGGNNNNAPPIGFFDQASAPPAPQQSGYGNQPPPPMSGGYQQPGFGSQQPQYQQGGMQAPYQPPGVQQPGFGSQQPPYQQGGMQAPYQPPGVQQPPYQQGGMQAPYQPPGVRQPLYQQGGIQQPPYQQQPAFQGGNHYNNQQQYNNSNRNWNVNDYLRQIFMQIDVDRNSFITPNELQQALAKAQANFNFDPRTIEFILRRFDTNRDQKISLDEFSSLYAYLNDEYATFMISDVNGNASIEANEMTNTLAARVGSYGLNQQTIQFIVQRIEQMLQSRITFDIFCRVNARFDILCRQYQQQRPPMPIEQFLMQQFFNDFF